MASVNARYNVRLIRRTLKEIEERGDLDKDRSALIMWVLMCECNIATDLKLIMPSAQRWKGNSRDIL